MSNNKSRLRRIGDEATKELSNYGGVYGQEDINMVDFEGSCNSFAERAKAIKDRVITFKITNKGLPEKDENGNITGYKDSDAKLNLFKPLSGIFASFLRSDNANRPGKAFDSSGAEVEVEITGNPLPYEEFLSYAVSNALSIEAMRIKSNNPLQMTGYFDYYYFTPFNARPKGQVIRLSDFEREDITKDNILTINKGFVVDANLDCVFTLEAGASISLTFYCGPVVNPGKGLTKALENKSSAIVKRAVPGIRFRK